MQPLFIPVFQDIFIAKMHQEIRLCLDYNVVPPRTEYRSRDSFALKGFRTSTAMQLFQKRPIAPPNELR